MNTKLTYQDFIETLKTINKESQKILKFERLAETVFADTDKDSVILIENCVFDVQFFDFDINLNLKRDGLLFFSTNIDKDCYNNSIVSSSYYYDEILRLYNVAVKFRHKFYPLIYNYLSPINIYFKYATKMNNIMNIDNSEMSDLFTIRYDLRRLKKAKFLTYSKVKNSIDYKIKFKQSGNEYQLQYFTAPMARKFGIRDFFEAKIDNYASEFNGKKVLMIETVLIDIYNEAKLIHTKILPEIESAKKQIYDFFEANQSSIKAKLEESFNAYISDTQNPVSYIMIYKNNTWQTVDRASYDNVVRDKYDGPIYVKYDRLTNQLVELHLSEPAFDKVVDYYINH
jgi:hypothetical protein